MNTSKTVLKKFTDKLEYPIWYYKELDEVSLSYVIFNMLIEKSFIININGYNYEITFGKDRKGEIQTCVKYDDMCNDNLTSYEVIEKGFKYGKWYIISDNNTTDEYKEFYRNKKLEYERNEARNTYIKIITNIINSKEKLLDNEKQNYISYINNCTYEELESYIKKVFK